MKRYRWDKKYLYWGITAFSVIAAAIVFYMLLNYVGAVRLALGALADILSPFIWGLVIAYLMTPLLNIYERRIFAPLCAGAVKRMKPRADGKKPRVARGLSVLFTEITLIFIIAALFYLILPQVYRSIETIVLSSPQYVRRLIAWAERILEDYPQIEQYAVTVLGNFNDWLTGWFNNTLLPSIDSIIQNVTTGVYVVLVSIYNVAIGLIVSVYILHNKETFGAHCKKILYSVFSLEAAERVQEGLAFTDKTFMGFITGKIVDSAIIGMLCYIFCAIAGMPYALLISVIIGVTNIIPFFGPFIGAIPSALLILLISPMKCLIFVIFIILLQQFDGNVLGPKILGNTTGISGFWVMFSIILGAGLFGFWGMLLGVPVWVVIYTWFTRRVNKKLRRSDLPDDTDSYIGVERIDPATREFTYRAQPAPRKKASPKGKASKESNKDDNQE